MDSATCARILNGGVCQTLDQQRHAFLTAVLRAVKDGGCDDDSNEPLDGRGNENDSSPWLECLINADITLLLRIPELMPSILQLASSLSNTPSSSPYSSSSSSSSSSSLIASFLQRPELINMVNSYLSSSSEFKAAGAMEWRAIANMSKMSLLLPSTFHQLIRLANKELAHLLDVTANVWDIDLSSSIRMRTENLLCTFNSIQQSSVEGARAVAEHCVPILLQLCKRLEEGIGIGSEIHRLREAQKLNENEDGHEHSVNGLFSSSDDEYDN